LRQLPSIVSALAALWASSDGKIKAVIDVIGILLLLLHLPLLLLLILLHLRLVPSIL